MIKRTAVNISLQPYELARLDRIAEKHNLSRSGLIRKWIADHTPCEPTQPTDTNQESGAKPAESSEHRPYIMPQTADNAVQKQDISKSPEPTPEKP